MKKEILSLKIYEWIYLLFWCLLIGILSIFNNSSFLSIVACILGILSAVFNMKGRKIAFIFFAAYSLTYGMASMFSHNYGEGILQLLYNFQLYLFTMYTLYFKKNIKIIDNKINKVSKKEVFIYLLIIPIFTFIYGFILKDLLNSNLPFINALATSFAVLASLLTSKRKKEQWYFWLGYSITLLYLWFNTEGEILYFYLNIFYTLNNTIGLINWTKRYKENKIIENV